MRLLARTVAWVLVALIAGVHLAGPDGRLALAETRLDITGDAQGLAPGASGRLVLVLSNPGDVPAAVTAVDARVTGGGTPACGPDALTVTPWAGRLEVPAGGEASVELDIAVRADEACAGQSWSLDYSAW